MPNHSTAKGEQPPANAQAAAPAIAAPAAVAAPQIIIPKRLGEAFFLPYQTAWIQDESRIKIMEKARQIGLSWATGYAVTRRKSRRGARGDAWISSSDETQARLFKEDCLGWAKVLDVACREMTENVLADGVRNSSFVLALASGCRIHCMSSNPDQQAGKRGDRVLDEFALNKHNRQLWDIAYPGITWGGCMEIISTHRGVQNLFNQLVVEAREGGNPKGISLHRVTLEDALNQGFLVKLKQKLPADHPTQGMDEAAYFDYIRAGCLTEEAFLQEFMCVPADESSAFISYDMLDACSYAANEAWETELDPAGEYFVGMDIGRTRDLTVIFVVERVAERRYTRRIIELAGQTFTAQAAAIGRYAVLPQVKRICIDATGIGRQLAEEASMRWHKVECVNFTQSSKEDMAIRLRRTMEDAALRIPRNPALFADFRAIRKETTASGATRYVGERSENGHSDRFWACALALLAAAPAGQACHIGIIGDRSTIRRRPFTEEAPAAFDPTGISRYRVSPYSYRVAQVPYFNHNPFRH